MNKHFGERLRESRKIIGKRQSDMARAIDINHSQWSRWESGQGYPAFKDLQKIGEQFRWSLDYLVMGIDADSAEIVRLLHISKSMPANKLVKLCEFLES